MPVTLNNTDYENSKAAVSHIVEQPAPPAPPSDAPVIPQAQMFPSAVKVASETELKRAQAEKAAADAAAAAKAAAAAPKPTPPPAASSGPKASDQLSPMFGGPSKATPTK